MQVNELGFPHGTNSHLALRRPGFSLDNLALAVANRYAAFVTVAYTGEIGERPMDPSLQAVQQQFPRKITWDHKKKKTCKTGERMTPIS